MSSCVLTAFARLGDTRIYGLLATCLQLANAPGNEGLLLRLPGGAEILPSVYLAQVVGDALAQRWQPRVAATLGCSLAEAPLTPRLADRLSAKLALSMRSALVQDLPPLAYQVLRIACAARGDRCAALQRVVAHFDWLESRAEQGGGGGGGARALRQVESSVLMTFHMIASQESGLGEDWCERVLGRVKLAGAKAAGQTVVPFSPPTPASRLSPFSAALLLVLARTPRLQEPAMRALRGCVLAFCSERERRALSPWAARLPRLPLPQEHTLRTPSRGGWEA